MIYSGFFPVFMMMFLALTFFMLMIMMMVRMAFAFLMVMFMTPAFFFMVVFVMMIMSLCGNHRIRFFLCGHLSDACFHFLSSGMVAVIGQGTLHEIQRHVGDAFQSGNLTLQLCCAVCAVNAGNFKFICCQFAHICHP